MSEPSSFTKFCPPAIAGQGGEAGGVQDQPVVAVAGVAERGDEGPAVACGGGDEADRGEGDAEQLGDPDDLLQK